MSLGELRDVRRDYVQLAADCHDFALSVFHVSVARAPLIRALIENVANLFFHDLGIYLAGFWCGVVFEEFYDSGHTEPSCEFGSLLCEGALADTTVQDV